MHSHQKVWTVGSLTYSKKNISTLFFWLLLGDFSWSLRDRSVAPIAQWYLSHLEVSNLAFGILTSSLPALLAILIGPLICYKSDRFRSRMGRRIPFLLITTPLAVAGMIGLALTPFMAARLHGMLPDLSLVAVSIVSFALFWTAFEIATIAGQFIFGGLLNDVVPHELIGRFFGLFRAVSLIAGMIFSSMIMGLVPNHFSAILLTIGVVYGLSFMWVCFKVKEGTYQDSPEEPKDTFGSRAFIQTIHRYFQESFGSKYYLSIFLMMTAGALALTPVNLFTVPYAESLDVGMDVYGKLLAVTFLISLLLAYFLGWLCDRFHPLRVTIAMLGLYAVVTACGAIFGTTKLGFCIWWVAHGVISGCYFTTSASLGQRLFPSERFAQFASAAGMLLGIANIFIAPVFGYLIDLSGGAYRYTFVFAFALTGATIFLGAWVYKKFQKYGGPASYQPPPY